MVIFLLLMVFALKLRLALNPRQLRIRLKPPRLLISGRQDLSVELESLDRLLKVVVVD